MQNKFLFLPVVMFLAAAVLSFSGLMALRNNGVEILSIDELIKKDVGGLSGAICTETDGGPDFFIKGTTTVSYGSYTDYCTGPGGSASAASNVSEYYCKNGEAISVEYACEFGCRNGACADVSMRYITPSVQVDFPAGGETFFQNSFGTVDIPVKWTNKGFNGLPTKYYASLGDAKIAATGSVVPLTGSATPIDTGGGYYYVSFPSLAPGKYVMHFSVETTAGSSAYAFAYDVSNEFTVASYSSAMANGMITGINIQSPGGVLHVTSGNTLQLSAQISPSTATNKNVIWSVEDITGSAEIDSAGRLLGVEPGTVVVKATASDGYGAYGVRIFTVDETSTGWIKILSPNGGESFSGSDWLLRTPIKWTSYGIPSWESVKLYLDSDSVSGGVLGSRIAIAEVPNTGTLDYSFRFGPPSFLGDPLNKFKVTAVTFDPADTIHKDSSDGYFAIDNAGLVKNINLTVPNNIATVAVGKPIKIYADILPIDAKYKEIAWSTEAIPHGSVSCNLAEEQLNTLTLTCSNLGIVLVKAKALDGSGIVGAKSIIIASNASPSVTVPVTNVAVISANNATTVYMNEVLQMSANVLPANASYKNVIWSISSGSNNGIIDPVTGLLTAKNIGSLTVKATATDGSGKFGTKTIIVKKVLVTNVTVRSETGVSSIGGGQSLKMVADILPINASIKNVTWSILSGAANASIDSITGVLVGNAIGNVTVKATAKDGSGKFGTKVISVTSAVVPVKSISISSEGDATSVKVGQKLQMIAYILPNNATNPTVKWSIPTSLFAKSGVASIDPVTGVLTGLKAGYSVNVQATANDGSGKYGQKIITIKP